MKKRQWLQLVLIAAFLAAFVLYRQYDALRTDTQAPQIEMSTTQIPRISVSDPQSALLQGVSARDEKDGDLTDKLVVESVQLIGGNGMIEVEYAVSDRSGNVAKATREAQYTDYVSPKFRLSRPLIFEENKTFDIMSVIGAVDVLDGDIQHRIKATTLTEESISVAGTHQLYFQVTNSVSDMAELVMPLEILEADRFDAELTLTNYLIYLPVGADFQAADYLKEFTHRDETVSLQEDLPRNYAIEISGDVSTRNPGVYPVTYKVSYTVRNAQNAEYDQTFTGYSKLIVVVEG